MSELIEIERDILMCCDNCGKECKGIELYDGRVVCDDCIELDLVSDDDEEDY